MPIVEWSEMEAVDKTIIAASRMIQGQGELPHRVVIRDLGDKFVVHTQVFQPGGKGPYFTEGNYFPKERDTRLPNVNPANCGAFKKAWSRFEIRVRHHLGMPDVEYKLRAVADISESIIKSLISSHIGDDEDDLRMELENDYMLESNLETFENLTGKSIRPAPVEVEEEEEAE